MANCQHVRDAARSFRMASEFQRRKITGVLDAMDTNDDGLLEQSDFQALADRWTTLRGLRPGSAEFESLTSIMLGRWSALLDLNHDGTCAARNSPCCGLSSGWATTRPNPVPGYSGGFRSRPERRRAQPSNSSMARCAIAKAELAAGTPA
jgi:hypothetical protein